MLRNKFFVIILFILLLAVIAYNYTFFRERRTQQRAQVAAAAQFMSDAPSIGSAASGPYQPTWRRDPFWYPGGVDRSVHHAVPAHTLQLEGTMVKEGKGYAIMNGEVVGVGDRIQGVVIVEIGDLSVKVKGPTGTRTISIIGDMNEKEN